MSIKVFIDQGHNPTNPNAGAEGNGYREQDIVFRVGKELYDLLDSDSRYSARLSRPSEITVIGNTNSASLKLRVDRANSWGADLFLSLHTNASELEYVSGTEVLVYSKISRGYKIGESVVKSISSVTGLRNRGVKARPDLYVLRKTRMPAVLCELGFITNESDAYLMARNPALFARAIYNGLNSYYF